MKATYPYAVRASENSHCSSCGCDETVSPAWVDMMIKSAIADDAAPPFFRLCRRCSRLIASSITMASNKERRARFKTERGTTIVLKRYAAKEVEACSFGHAIEAGAVRLAAWSSQTCAIICDKCVRKIDAAIKSQEEPEARSTT